MNKLELPICYLAPELTALESTYVYEELLSLEKTGYKVIPVSLHRTAGKLIDNQDLLERTNYLYEAKAILTFIYSFFAFFRMRTGRFAGFKLLLADILEIGLLKTQSWKLVFQYFVAMRLVEILKKYNCQHMHIHFAHVPTQVGMYASAISGTPFTVMAHANDIFERGVLLQRKAERAVKLLTISEHNIKFLCKQGVPKNKLAVVRCGVRFNSPEYKIHKAKKDFLRIGTLGRIVEKKGMDVLVDAVSMLKDRSYTMELSIAGDGPLLDDLHVQVNRLGLSKSVQFVGSLSHEQVKEWMSQLDVFVLACKVDSNGDMDGIPVVLMEAMSQGIPVISTNLSGIPELIIHEQTGLLVEPNDSNDLAVQLDRLVMDPHLRKKIQANGADHVQKEFGQKTNIDRLVNYFGI